jgi:transcriptional regulator with XRE-family HTH domain
MKSFGAKVKEQRGNLGLSQKQLAEKAGMGIRTITSYELGERKPYQAQLYKLAKALEVSTEYLQNDNIEDYTDGTAQANANGYKLLPIKIGVSISYIFK